MMASNNIPNLENAISYFTVLFIMVRIHARSLKSTHTAHMRGGPKKVGGTKKLVEFFFIYSLLNSLAFFQINVSEQSWNTCNCEEK